MSIALRDAFVMGMLRGAHGDAARALANAEDQAALDPSSEGQAFWQDIIPYLRLLAATRRGGMRAESPRAPRQRTVRQLRRASAVILNPSPSCRAS